eukprot:5823828-Lingulodinium_polyedra.AAC.1
MFCKVPAVAYVPARCYRPRVPRGDRFRAGTPLSGDPRCAQRPHRGLFSHALRAWAIGRVCHSARCVCATLPTPGHVQRPGMRLTRWGAR